MAFVFYLKKPVHTPKSQRFSSRVFFQRIYSFRFYIQTYDPFIYFKLEFSLLKLMYQARSSGTFLKIFKFVYFQLEDNCFTILCWFLPHINMNQPQVYICPLPLESPPHLPLHPTPLGHHRVLGCGPYAIQQLPTSYLF